MVGEDWADRAACKGAPSDLFFVEVGEREPPAGAEAMRAVCAPCPVRAECLEEGLRFVEYRYGSCRGGLLPREQRALIKRRVLEDGVYTASTI